MLTQYQKLRLLTAAGMEGPSREAVMGMEEEEGLPGSRRRGVEHRGNGEEELGELAANTGNRDGVRGSQAFSSHFGTLGRRGCPGERRA